MATSRKTLDSAPPPVPDPRLPQSGELSVDSLAIYYDLRRDIMNGQLPPGAMLNQVHLAEKYKLSRTPVREALRMLQVEGLAESKFKYRMKVTKITASEVDEIYGLWIAAQALAVDLTMPRITPGELKEVRQVLKAMNKQSLLDSDVDSWQNLHIRFHRLLSKHAGPTIYETIDNYWSRSERARRAYAARRHQASRDVDEEHAALVEAYEARDTSSAIRLTALQLARTACAVIANIDADYRPAITWAAFRMVTGEEFPFHST